MLAPAPSSLPETPLLHLSLPYSSPLASQGNVLQHANLHGDTFGACFKDTAAEQVLELKKDRFRRDVCCTSVQSVLQEDRVANPPETFSPPAALNLPIQGCIDTNDLQTAGEVHGLVERLVYVSDATIGSNVIRMFASNGSLAQANEAFHKLINPNVFSWSAIIFANAKNGQGKEAIRLYHKMQDQCIHPDGHVFVAVLQACANTDSLSEGEIVYTHIVACGYATDPIVGNALIAMYNKCGYFDDALLVFNKMLMRDIVTWSAMIEGCAESGHMQEAFCLFDHMQKEGFDPNSVTFLNILKACSSSIPINQGMQVHAEIIQRGFESEVTISSSLLVMYSKYGSMDDALRIFHRQTKRNTITWNAMIMGCAENGHGEFVLPLFESMKSDGLEPTRATFIGLLKACFGKIGLEQGKLVHCHIVRTGLDTELIVGNALIDMYGKCDSLTEARSVFDKLLVRDVITWGALMNAYAQHGPCQEPLMLFSDMLHAGVEPNQGIFVSILKACASIAAVEQGKLIHASIIVKGLEFDTPISNCLVTMYAKCGDLSVAERVFSNLSNPDIITWNSLISGYALHRNYEAAHGLFMTMLQAGFRPDSVTFICLLSACSHANLVDEGWYHYHVMSKDYGISPTEEHTVCMVELLGRAGRLQDAENLLESTPSQSNIVGWKSLLFNSQEKGDVEMGERCFYRVTTLDSKDPASYVLMFNIYTNAGMWEKAAKVGALKKRACVWKKPGKAFIEVGGSIHNFVVGDKSHPRSDEIYAKLKVFSQMEVASTSLRKQTVSPALLRKGSDEDTLCGHCERLAIAFGLLCSPNGTTIRVSKNLRMCVDCHGTAKLISKVEKREIIVADSYCIHQFRDGSCVCKDS